MSDKEKKEENGKETGKRECSLDDRSACTLPEEDDDNKEDK